MKKSKNSPLTNNHVKIFLAEDDKVDCQLFKEVLEELPLLTQLTTFHNGEQLLNRLIKKPNDLPDVLFLDLNMPRKNGFVSLGIIKRDNILDKIPVVILSSANEDLKIKRVFNDAAHYYIRKPNDFSELKNVINKALTLIMQDNSPLPREETFILKGDLKAITNESKSPAKELSGKIN
jgi:CheY-like chemotaxis protein